MGNGTGDGKKEITISLSPTKIISAVAAVVTILGGGGFGLNQFVTDGKMKQAKQGNEAVATELSRDMHELIEKEVMSMKAELGLEIARDPILMQLIAVRVMAAQRGIQIAPPTVGPFFPTEVATVNQPVSMCDTAVVNQCQRLLEKIGDRTARAQELIEK